MELTNNDIFTWTANELLDQHDPLISPVRDTLALVDPQDTLSDDESLPSLRAADELDELGLCTDLLALSVDQGMGGR